ncbi:rod shape-determining protein MreD [Pseudogracilibacillus sp. SE30717A]|uniref:rod shape-determining protein MreD n=1 Tax=Pseudogracilibacillus sp. SE30717A TaxID=3098293 RepID=UPI00300DF55D
MKRLLFPLILFLLLVSEGVALDLLPSFLTSSDTLIVPHWVLMFLILVCLFYDTSETFFAIVYGVCFGLLVDVVYTGVLGVYMFIYPFSLYIVHLLKRFLQTNLSMTIIIAFITISITEFLLFFIFTIVDIVDVTMTTFLLHRLLPTILANIIFLIPIYLLSVKHLHRWSDEHFGKHRI